MTIALNNGNLAAGNPGKTKGSKVTPRELYEMVKDTAWQGVAVSFHAQRATLESWKRVFERGIGCGTRYEAQGKSAC